MLEIVFKSLILNPQIQVQPKWNSVPLERPTGPCKMQKWVIGPHSKPESPTGAHDSNTVANLTGSLN